MTRTVPPAFLALHWILRAAQGRQRGRGRRPAGVRRRVGTRLVTLALDFPVRSGTAALLDGLDEITHRHGGRVHLAKDARCAPERLREGYPRLDAFEAVRAETAGAPSRFASELSRRLAL